MAEHQNTTPTLRTGAGSVVTEVDPLHTQSIAALAQQADGKMVAVGAHFVVRYLADGSVDTGFGQLGIDSLVFTLPDGQYGTDLKAVQVRADGQILVAGNLYAHGADITFFLARLNPDGSLDTSFGSGNGYVSTNIGERDLLTSMLLEADGKILLAGTSGSLSSDTHSLADGLPTSIALARYLPDGSLDPSFGHGGTMLDADTHSRSAALALQADGKIIVAGTDTAGGGVNDFTLSRFNADGSADSTFGSAGKVHTSFAHVAGEPEMWPAFMWAYYPEPGLGLAVQGDGKIVVAGSAPLAAPGPSAHMTAALFRFNSDGSKDVSFDGDGVLLVPTASALDPGLWSDPKSMHQIETRATTVQIDPAGRLLVAGTSFERISADYMLTDTITAASIQSTNVVLARVDSAGHLDTSFGAGGVQTGTGTPYAGVERYTISDALYYYQGGAQEHAMLQRPDGSIMLAGGIAIGNGEQFLLSRFTGAGAIDQDFGAPAQVHGNTVSYLQGRPGVLLGAAMLATDADLAALAGGHGNYAGAILTLARSGAANADDLFSAEGRLHFVDGDAILNANKIGSVTEVGGTLRLVFNASANQERLDETLQSIGYVNLSAAGAAENVDIVWTFSDANTGQQGSGGAASAQFHTSVAVAPAALPYWIESLLAGDANGQARQNDLDYLGAQKTLNVSFPAHDGMAPFSAEEQAMIWHALGYAASVLDLHFVAGSDTGSNSLSFYNFISTRGAAGEAYYPGPNSDDGDVYIKPGKLAQSYVGPHVLMHELGHALGMKHPFDDGDPGETLSAVDDTTRWTQMAYIADSTNLAFRQSNEFDFKALDIAALQYLYGPNPSSRSGDNVYALDVKDSNFIWDGAGTDTISAAGLAQNLTLHLAPGFWDYLGARGPLITSPGQITVNFGSAIENAIGGSGHDAITGNGSANLLRGGLGNDTLDGGAGIDTALFSGSRASYSIAPQADGTLRITGLDGHDTLSNIEWLRFDDALLLGATTLSGALTLSGLSTPGQTLAAGPLHAGADGLGQITYQWQRDGVNIAGATATSLTLSDADLGHTFSVRASYNGSAGLEYLSSLPSARVLVPNTAPTGHVWLDGSASVGQSLRAANDLADADGMGALHYQWLRDGTPVDNPAADSYMLSNLDIGHAFSVRADWTDAKGHAESALSNASANVGDHSAPQLLNVVTEGAQQATLLVTFNEAVVPGSGTVALTNDAGLTVLHVAADTLSVSGATLRLALGDALSGGGNYQLSFTPGSLRDLAGNAFGGVAAYAFSTVNGPVMLSAPATGGTLRGGSNSDVLTGSASDDNFIGGAGNDYMYGRAGFDVAVYAGQRADFTVQNNGGWFSVQDMAGNEGLDVLVDIERIRFADGAVALDLDGAAGKLYRLYKAAFDRTPDQAGFSYWLAALDHGSSVQTVAAAFGASVEFTQLYGGEGHFDVFLSSLYAHVLHRPPDQGGADWWRATYASGGVSLADVLISFAESAENQAQLVGVIGNGIPYTPWVG
ncbi:MAG: M57 family metalloprotease [Pseudomonadota bacterium]